VRHARFGAAILLAAALYFAAAKAGFAISFVNGTVSAVWPPTGIALAVLLLGGRRMWPAIFLGEFASDFFNHSPVLICVFFALGSTAEALTGYWLLRLMRFRPKLDRVRDVFALLVLAAMLSTMVSATIGTTTLLVSGSIGLSGVWSTWHVWWLGDFTGDVIVAPLLLVLAQGRPRIPRGWRLAETVAFALVLAALAAIAHALTLGIAYLVLPVLIWAALRFRQTGAVIANAVLAGVGVIAAATASSQLTRVSVVERVLFTQNFVIVGAITTLVLAAVISERNRNADAVRDSEASVRALLRERTAFNQIATAIAGGLATDQLFDLMAEQVAMLLAAARVIVVRVEDDQSATAIAAWARDGVPGIAAGSPFPLSPTSASAHALLTGSSARSDGDPPNVPGMPGERIASPIRVDGQIWGTLAVAAGSGRRFPEGTEQLLEQLADLASMAIQSTQARAQLLTEATTDPLTGLANHRLFERRLGEESSRAVRYRRPLAVALIDLDSFKTINDTAGHPVGDAVLVEVTKRISVVTREDSLLARLGGDEFALLLPECGDMQSYAVAERIRRAISSEPFEGYGRVTASVGIAETTQAADRKGLRQLADLALYAAKLQGGDRSVRYSPALSVDSVDLIRARKLMGLRSLAQAIDARDSATVEHSRRVADLAVALARERNWAPEQTELLREAALVHDVGKIGVPEAILLAPRALEPEEYEQVKQHSTLGAQLAADVLNDDQVAWIRWHHERADGMGYPDGLPAEQVPEGAKLLAIADAWDAMISKRPYHPAKPVPEALDECRQLSGRQFAPEAVTALLAVASANIDPMTGRVVSRDSVRL
jgi:diguanylate cyclase (GGDEF)-like protein/putative nucleotidyltransferase with HDIG domain